MRAHPAYGFNDLGIYAQDIPVIDRFMVRNAIPESPKRIEPAVNCAPFSSRARPEGPVKGLAPERMVVSRAQQTYPESEMKLRDNVAMLWR